MLIGGLFCLVIGGEFLVNGSSKVAASLGISPLVIGLTIVAFGTSSPELVVSVQAGLSGHGDMAIANVLGSNIFNILFILGSCALLAPLIVSSQLVRMDVPVMIVSSFILFFMARDGQISGPEGFILMALVVGYTFFLIVTSRRESKAVDEEFSEAYPEKKLRGFELMKNLFFIAGGIGLLILGGDLLVKSSVIIATSLGVSEAVIGLTIVAAGTSLPEVATSLIATVRGQRDIAIGNIVGSNIFNVLFIIGASSVVSPRNLNVNAELLAFDFPVMIAACVACLPIFLAGFRITRLDGAVFFLSYIFYLTFLVLRSTEHHFYSDFRNAMIYFILPALGLSILGSSYQAVMLLKRQGWRITPSGN